MRQRLLATHELRLFFVALQFLTRIPAPARLCAGYEPQWLNDCVRYFPLVGALVGVTGATVLCLAILWWTPPVAALLAVAATVWVTGAFHEDGLADTFDALGGVVPRQRALEIMKDSRIGTYGATALALTLALRIALLAMLAAKSPAAAAAALIGAHVLGRAAAICMMALLPYAGDADHAKAKPLATSVRLLPVAWGVASAILLVAGLAVISNTAWVATSGVPVGGWMLAAGATLLVVWSVRWWLRRRLGGYTGDTLGATEQLTEIAVLLVLSGA